MSQQAGVWPPWLSGDGDSAAAELCVSGTTCAGCTAVLERPLLRCEACRSAYFCSSACAEGAGALRHASACVAATSRRHDASAPLAPPLDHLPFAALLAEFSDDVYYPPPLALRGADALLQYDGLPRHARCTLECGDAEAARTLGSFGAVVLPLRDVAVDTLRVRLRARTGVCACLPMGGDDEPRGSAQVPLARLRSGKRRTLRLTLSGPGGGGSLRIALQLLPLPDAARLQGSSSAASGAAFVDYPDGPPTERWSYEPLCFISHGVTDPQAAMWRSRRGCTVVLAFRGTDPGNVRDVATDLRTATVTTARFDFADGASEPLAHARVHAGFQDAYASVRHRVRSALDAAICAGAPATLLITGHSLGGALATLCAVDVAESWAQAPPVQHPPRIVLHTFGSPRVGDATFVSRLAVHVPTALRFVSGLDLVPSAPLVATGYAHAGTGVHLPHADAPQAAVATHLPGIEYERPHAEVAAAAASGLGVLHHLMGSYHGALERQLKERESKA